MFALLDEQQTRYIKSKSKRSTDNNEQEGMQSESDLDFSSRMTILPGLSFKSGKTRILFKFLLDSFLFFFPMTDISVVTVCFCQDKPEQVAVFYEPVC